MQNHQEITVQKVAAFSKNQEKFISLPNGVKQEVTQNQARVTISAPPRTLVAFKRILQDTPIIGASYTNPYTNILEYFPRKVNEFTLRHLHILARNENSNTSGKMKIELYNRLLDEDQVGSLRALVKNTAVAGITYATHYQQFFSDKDPEKKTHLQKIILIDQSGLQWQGNWRNTGGLFFYPDDTSLSEDYMQQKYSDLPAWQHAQYQDFFGMARPSSLQNSKEVGWLGKNPLMMNGKLDIDGVTKAFEQEFLNALYALSTQADYLESNEYIVFRFLQAGTGAFANGLNIQHDHNCQTLKDTRLSGIAHALQRICDLPVEVREKLLKKLVGIQLPFSEVPEKHNILSLVKQLNLDWYGSYGCDALQPITQYQNNHRKLIIATTNCGDPHAMTGNEGELSANSADAFIAAHAYVNLANACHNSAIKDNMQPDWLANAFCPQQYSHHGLFSNPPSPNQTISQTITSQENAIIIETANAKFLYQFFISKDFPCGLSGNKLILQASRGKGYKGMYWAGNGELAISCASDKEALEVHEVLGLKKHAERNTEALTSFVLGNAVYMPSITRSQSHDKNRCRIS